MKRFLVIVFLVAPCCVLAQLPSAELYTVSPPVIEAGKATEVTFRGANLEELSSLHFSDNRIKAELVDGEKFRVTVPSDFSPGQVEVRAAGYFGLSTSRPLTIAQPNRPLVGDSGKANHNRATAPALAVEALAYGVTDANQTNWYTFPAKKGERLLIHCYAERIDSMADATLTLVDKAGNELERDRDTVGRDPLLDFTAPADGDYFVGVHDFLYNGGANFPYLLEVTSRPWIDAVFPPATQQGTVTDLTLLGRNLPGGSLGDGLEIDGKPVETVSVRVTAPMEADTPAFDANHPSRAMLPTFPYRLEGSNAVDIGLTMMPVTVVKNDEDIPTFVPPGEIAARFDKDGDTDEFRFLAAAGKTYWLEVIGERIAGHIDPYLVIDGTKTEAADSAGLGGATFDDASRDAAMKFKADKAGEYSVTVVNRFASGGPEHNYRLAIREAVPEFEIVGVLERSYLDVKQAFPATPLLRKGGVFPMRVLINRKDGFDGPITLTAEGLPAGVSCPSVTVSGNESSARIVFSATPDAATWNGEVSVFGSAKIGGKDIRLPLRIGTLVFGITDYNTTRIRSRLAHGLPLSVSEHEKAPVSLEIGSSETYSVTLGEKLEIPVKVTARNGLKGNLTVTPLGLRGLTKPPTVTIDEKKNEAKLVLDFTAKKGAFAPEFGTWNFVVKAFGTTKHQLNPEAAERAAEELKRIEAKPDATDAEKEEARKHAKTATDRAKEKDVMFATYSLPLTVEVKPAPKETEKKSP